jgi:hypothetical protein
MNGLLRIGALGVLLGLSACYLPEVRPEKIAKVEPNVTTADQVVELFGLPTSELTVSGGSKVFVYYRSEFARTFEQNIPFYNMFYNEYDTGTYDYFVFNREGVLQSFSIPHFASEAKVANPGS